MRAFVAIELPERLRRLVEDFAVAQRARLPKARWIPAANLHVTLAFLGEVDDLTLGRYCARLDDVASLHRQLRLRTDRAGAFPPRGRARVLWLGIGEDPELTSLQTGIADAIGLAIDEQPFRPHVTMARCRRP